MTVAVRIDRRVATQLSLLFIADEEITTRMGILWGEKQPVSKGFQIIIEELGTLTLVVSRFPARDV